MDSRRIHVYVIYTYMFIGRAFFLLSVVGSGVRLGVLQEKNSCVWNGITDASVAYSGGTLLEVLFFGRGINYDQ